MSIKLKLNEQLLLALPTIRCWILITAKCNTSSTLTYTLTKFNFFCWPQLQVAVIQSISARTHPGFHFWRFREQQSRTCFLNLKMSSILQWLRTYYGYRRSNSTLLWIRPWISARSMHAYDYFTYSESLTVTVTVFAMCTGFQIWWKAKVFQTLLCTFHQVWSILR